MPARTSARCGASSTERRTILGERAAVRPAVEGDLPAIQAIYAHHVRTGLASFEEEPPSLEEMRRRHAEITSAGFPYLAADFGGSLAGYGYCSLYRARSAYRFALEDSVYVRADVVGKGVGRTIL